ncbi:MAG TPA: polysaccharide biosynthesis/export family protein [Terracidiphilus sp.]|nr:polysaccharide biosynthesis/export family protein [Terracidiphilus sp.]
MKSLIPLLLAMTLTGSILAQQQPLIREGAGQPAPNEGANLPVEKIGSNDLLGVSVYDSPELTRTVRVGFDGDIRLPMVEQHIHASGLYPEELERAIAAILSQDKILRRPIVSVSVMEYRSRAITVAGAVKMPVTFQAAGPVKLLDAISQAQGLTDNAGSEILVSSPEQGPDGRSTSLVRRISVHSLFTEADAESNIELQGGEEIRVPEAGRVFVVGRVKKPGFYYLTDGPESSILKALALSDGLDSHPAGVAYIYRAEAGEKEKRQIPVELKDIMKRKAPDVSLVANDILYIPNNGAKEATLKTLEFAVPIALALGTTLLYVAH